MFSFALRKYIKKALLIFIATAVIFSPAVSAENTVTDMVGRKVVVPDDVKKIVTTYKSATQFVLALRAGDRLTGVSVKSAQQPLFTALQPNISSLPEVGSKRKGLNLETILETDPDLVILFPYGDGPEIAGKLKEHGVASLIINPESLGLIRETTRLLGEVLDQKEQADNIIGAYDSILESVKHTAELPQKEKKVIYFGNSEFTDTVGAEMLQTAVIEHAGGINPAADLKAGFIKASAENIIEWNPDLAVVSQFYREDINSLLEDSRFKHISAFKEDEIYRFPSSLEPWDFPSPSSYIAVIWLAKTAYPEKFKDLDYKKTVNEFYKTLYGMSFEKIGGEF
ncbi:MAG: ABC transporter substrate-binding protein [Bacillota bacterium]